MNAICPMLSPFSTPRICPFLTMFMTSYPCNVFHAVSTEKKPSPGLGSQHFYPPFSPLSIGHEGRSVTNWKKERIPKWVLSFLQYPGAFVTYKMPIIGLGCAL